MMIENVQDLLTCLTTMDATATRRFPISAASVRVRTDEIRDAIGRGWTLGDIRPLAIEIRSWAFMGSGAGMKWLDATWERLVDAFPLPVDSAEVAAHITNELMGANR